MKQAAELSVLTYACHPFIIGLGHRIMMLENLIRRILDDSGVFQRVDETVDEVRVRLAAGVTGYAVAASFLMMCVHSR